MNVVRRLAGLGLAVLIVACDASTVSPSPPSGSGPSDGPADASATAPPLPVGGTSAPLVPRTPSPSGYPGPEDPAGRSSPVRASPAPSAGPPEKFGYAAKGMSHEVMAFVPAPQLDYAVETMDWAAVSTVAYFSLEAKRDGTIARDGGWRAWNSTRMDRLIEAARANGTRVVMSLKRFSWSAGQTAISRELLSTGRRRARLAREVADEVARRGVDGVNVDFEPIPHGQKDAFTDFVRRLRRELDRARPGAQLTFCVIGHHESYDVDAATGPDAADAVYLMGYHYAGTWSSRAGSTAPMGGPAHDVVDSVKSLLREVERDELIVGVPYYGHAWPTAGSGLHAATRGGGFDVTLERAVDLAQRHDVRYDKVEQVAWFPYRARPCDGCAVTWHQLYFDDARALAYKLAWIKRSRLLGAGVWTIGFEGQPGPHAREMRKAFLGG